MGFVQPYEKMEFAGIYPTIYGIKLILPIFCPLPWFDLPAVQGALNVPESDL